MKTFTKNPIGRDNGYATPTIDIIEIFSEVGFCQSPGFGGETEDPMLNDWTGSAN